MDRTAVQIMVVVVFGWFVAWLLLGAEAAWVDGPLFPIVALYLAAVVSSSVSLIKIAGAAIPGLLGMIIIGAILRNVGAVDSLQNSWSSAIRKLALAIILTRAGLVLSVEAVVRLGRPTMMLSTLPCLVEAAVVAVATRLMLTSPTFPWSWCFMMGFIVAAVSPAVIVPALTDLQQRGYGVAQGIPSMILAAAGIDDVVAVTGFGVAFGICFASNIAMSIAQGPIDVAIGLAAPVVAGVPFSRIVLDDMFDLGLTQAFKTAMLLLIGVSFVVGFSKLDYTGGGALSAMILGVVIQRASHTKDTVIPPMSAALGVIWERLAKPLLFVLIGAAIDIGTLSGSTVGYGIAIIAIGLTARLPIVMGCMLGTKLTRTERYFVALAWLPKATVQAALGSLALDEVTKHSPVDKDEEVWAERILAVSVLAILCTAPVGAVLIEVFGERWLAHGPAKDTEPVDEEAQPAQEEEAVPTQPGSSNGGAPTPSTPAPGNPLRGPSESPATVPNEPAAGSGSLHSRAGDAEASTAAQAEGDSEA